MIGDLEIIDDTPNTSYDLIQVNHKSPRSRNLRKRFKSV